MKKIFVSISLFLTFLAYAQVITHTVEAQETIYGISTQYGISQQQLKDANPFLKERGLQVGDVLTIPGQQAEQGNTLPEDKFADYEDNEFYYRVIKPKQTLYSLSKEYDVSQEKITSLNPFINERGLQPNDVVRIPKKQTQPERIEETVQVPEGMHLVKAGDTVYSLATQYNLEMSDIYAANRNLQTDGLKIGEFINIPKKKSVSIPEGESYFEHLVVKDETVFSLLRKYEVDLEELISLNPELENGLQKGMTLKVPLKKGAKLEKVPSYVVASGENFKDDEINIAWMMPFYLDTPNAHKGERQVAQDFYMGGQIALEQLIKSGKKVNVNVIDINRDKEALDKFLDSPEFAKTDAVIGPFFEEMIAHIALKLEKTDIPVFSPLINSESLEAYKNVYLATPRNEFAADMIVSEMATAYDGKQEIKVLTNSSDEKVANYLKNKFLKRFGSAKVTITKNPNDLKLVAHTETTTNEAGEEVEVITYEPILAVLAADNNTLGAQFVEVITDQDPASITGFSTFFVPALDVFDRNNVKNINALKEIGFTYTAARLVNSFGDYEKNVIANFQDKYCTLPNKYMAIGYDIVTDVLDRMDQNGKISDFDARRSETRLSSKFGYEKVEDGNAKINKELRLIRLN